MPHLINLNGAKEFDSSTIMSFADWQALDAADQADVLAVMIHENESIIEGDLNLDNLELVAFNFAKFADGRAFSQARILRETLGFTGDIRAVGDFIPDQVAFLARCGFTSFEFKSEPEAEIATRIKSLVTAQYQSDVVEKKPLFRRR